MAYILCRVIFQAIKVLKNFISNHTKIPLKSDVLSTSVNSDRRAVVMRFWMSLFGRGC